MKIKRNGHKCTATIVTNDVKPPGRRKRKRKRTSPRETGPDPVVARKREQLAADIDWIMNRPSERSRGW